MYLFFWGTVNIYRKKKRGGNAQSLQVRKAVDMCLYLEEHPLDIRLNALKTTLITGLPNKENHTSDRQVSDLSDTSRTSKLAPKCSEEPRHGVDQRVDV